MCGHAGTWLVLDSVACHFAFDTEEERKYFVEADPAAVVQGIITDAMAGLALMMLMLDAVDSWRLLMTCEELAVVGFMAEEGGAFSAWPGAKDVATMAVAEVDRRGRRNPQEVLLARQRLAADVRREKESWSLWRHTEHKL